MGSIFLANRLIDRFCTVVAVLAPPSAAAIVLVAGASTPGYSALTFTISRQAAAGMPFAFPIELGILITAFGCFALSAIEPRSRWMLTVAGGALVLAAIFRYDPTSERLTLVHRLFTAIAVVGLVVAPLGYGRISFIVGTAELALLVSGLALLATPFDAWGLWERSLLAFPLAWMTAVAARRLSRAEITRTAAASLSKKGS